GAVAEARDRDRGEGARGMVDEREPAVAAAGRREGSDQDEPGAHAVGEGAAGERAGEARRRVGRGDEAGEPERQAADVVQVDEDEGQGHAPPEGVDDDAGLVEPERARELRVQLARCAGEPGRERKTSMRFDPRHYSPTLRVGSTPVLGRGLTATRRLS